jgi:fatty-acyl-CoA synthase
MRGTAICRAERLHSQGFDGRVAKWWRPDHVIFVDELPHTAAGKLLKTERRRRYRDHLAG